MKHQTVSEKLSITQVAEQLNCSRRHVENLVAEGQLRAAKIGRLVRIDSLDVERLFQANRIDRGITPEFLCKG